MVCCAIVEPVKKKVADSETDTNNDVVEDVNKNVGGSETDAHIEEDVNKNISDRKIVNDVVDDVNITGKKTDTDPAQTIGTSTMTLTGISYDVSVNKIGTNPRVFDILAQIPKEKRTTLENELKEGVSDTESTQLTAVTATNITTKKSLPILPSSTRRPNIQDLETTPYTTPSSVLKSNSTKLSTRLEPQWNFFRIGFKLL